MNKFKIWVLALSIYLMTFGLPILISYILFQGSIESKKGGGLLYFTLAIIFTAALRKILAGIKKMKASIPKAIFKAAVSLIVLYIVSQFIGYVNVNFDNLFALTMWAIGGRFVAFWLEILALKIDKVYVEEIGVI